TTDGTRWRLNVSVSMGSSGLGEQCERDELAVEQAEREQADGDEAVEGREVEAIVDPAVGEPAARAVAPIGERREQLLGGGTVAGDERLARRRDELAAAAGRGRRRHLATGAERGEPSAASAEIEAVRGECPAHGVGVVHELRRL